MEAMAEAVEPVGGDGAKCAHRAIQTGKKFWKTNHQPTNHLSDSDDIGDRGNERQR